MSWLFSRALVGAFSAGTCSAGEPFAPSSGSHTPQAYLSPDRMMAYSRLSRFGMTFAPLTADRGEELLTWYREGFPARTYPLPEKAQGSKESVAGYGERWRGSLARFDPDTCSWKTVQHSLLEDSDGCSVIWPRSGMTANGLCWELPMLALRINGTGSGLWPTPTVCGNYNRKWASATSGDGLATAVRMWPTPTRRDYRSDSCTPGVKAIRDAHTRGKTLPWEVGGLLNPTWVEWLMGWPLGWTDLKPLEMARFRQWLLEHSPSYRRDSDKAAA